jgi:acyl transferase domain-containing protein
VSLVYLTKYRPTANWSRDGHTPGISLPSADAQEKVIRKAYTKAGLDFADTDYVECHGTGTAVGDPIEVDALSRCLTPRLGEPLLIGSVRAAICHLLTIQLLANQINR